MPRGYVAVVQDVRGRYPLGRPLAPAARRRHGRIRPRRVDRPAAVVERAHRHGRHVLRRRHPARDGDRQRPAPRGDGAGRRDVEPGRYGIRHNGAFELRWFNWVFTLGNATGAARAAGVRRPPGRTPAPRRCGPPRPRSPSPLSRTWASACASTSTALPLRPGRRRCASPPTTRRGWSRPCATATTTASGRTWARASSITSRSTRTCPCTTSPAGTTRGARRSRTSTTSSSAGRRSAPSASSSGRGRTAGSS